MEGPEAVGFRELRELRVLELRPEREIIQDFGLFIERRVTGFGLRELSLQVLQIRDSALWDCMINHKVPSNIPTCKDHLGLSTPEGTQRCGGARGVRDFQQLPLRYGLCERLRVLKNFCDAGGVGFSV